MIPVFAVKNKEPVPKVAGTNGEGIGSLFGLNWDWIAMKGSKKVSLSPSSPRGPLLFGLAMPRQPRNWLTAISRRSAGWFMFGW